jgi:phosphatidylethanolamine/phosphatidyl-N-methylethanolamine N-methyltransferase
VLGGFIAAIEPRLTWHQSYRRCAPQKREGLLDERSKEFLREVETLDNGNVEAAYARWAPIYDLTFATLLKPGRRAAAAAASKAHGPILDVGVGTGLELPMFAAKTQVIGVDLSEPMLRRAAQRVRREHLSHVAGLVKMDATRMAFSTSFTFVAPLS